MSMWLVVALVYLAVSALAAVAWATYFARTRVSRRDPTVGGAGAEPSEDPAWARVEVDSRTAA